MQQFKFSTQLKKQSRFNNWVKTAFISFAFLIGAIGNTSEAQVSLSFSNGYIGTQGSNTNQADNIKKLSTMGIARVSFGQPYIGQFGANAGTQGNDLTGTIKIYLAAGATSAQAVNSVITLNGALNWRETSSGNTIEVFGFILGAAQNATISYNSQTFNLIGGTTARSSSTLGLKAYAGTFTFIDNENRSGNAATNGLLDALNFELNNTPQPSTITLTNNSVTEGQNLVYNVALSSATTSGNPQVYTFSFTGTSSSTVDYSTNITFTNGVINNGDGTITVPGGVSSFAITVSTIDDVNIESTETLILNIGSKSATGNILDNDLTPVLTTTGTLKTFSSCSGCTVAPQSFTVSGVDLSINNIVVTAPTGMQVSTNANSGFASSINIAPTAGTVTTTTVYAKLTSNATSVASGIISVTSIGAAAKTLTVTTNTDNALNFDGINDYVVLPSSLGSAYNSSAFTIEAWIKTTEAKGVNEIIGWGSSTVSNNVVEFRTTGGKLQFLLNNGSGIAGGYYQLTGTNYINTGKWIHVAAVKSGTNVVLYVNGQVEANLSGVTTSPSLNTVNIGVLAYKGTNPYGPIPDSYFSGSIDQLRVWNTARTSSDIAANMFVEMAGNEAGLVASYDFNQGIANGTNVITTLNDNSINAYNGTLTNFPTTMSGAASNFVAGFIPEITAAGNATSVSTVSTLQLSNGLIGGVWASSNTSLATVNSTTGMVSGVASGTVTITYTVCSKTVSYALTVVTPTINVTGSFKTFTSCSGCTITPQSFNVAGTNLGSNVIVTAPAGFELSNASGGTYSSTLTLTPSSGTLASTNVFARLINNSTTAASGNFTVASTGAVSRTVTTTVNTDNALHFDGIDDLVYLDNTGAVSNLAFTGTANFTIEAWVKREDYAGLQMLISKYKSGVGANYYLGFDNGKPLFNREVNPYRVTADNVLPVNEWHHIAGVYDGANMKLYIDGVLVKTEVNHTGSINSSVSSVPVAIGGGFASDGSVVYKYKGAVDEVRFWNTARTSDQIRLNYLNELVGNETGLVAYYDFNKGIINGTNSINDIISNKTNVANINGTLQNFFMSGTRSNFVSGIIPNITASGNATTLLAGGTLALSNGLVGGVWSSSNSNVATINASTGLITGVAGGNATMSYTICGKVVTYNATVLVPTLTTGTLKTFTSCSGCTIPAQLFTVAGTNLGSNVIITAPTGFELSGTSTGT